MNQLPWGQASAIKRGICEIGKMMYDRGFVAANDGNISVRLGADRIIVTPTMVSKGYMKPSILVTTDLEGRVLSGRMRPSSELKMHLAVYRERPDVRAVVHAHPANATGFAVAGLALDKPFMPELVVNLGAGPLAPYATPSTEEVPRSIEGLVKGHGALLLSNHGVLAWGRDLAEAYDHLETVELYAKILIAARTVGEPRAIAGEKLEALYRIREALGLS